MRTKTHTIELDPLQAKALRGGATQLWLPWHVPLQPKHRLVRMKPCTDSDGLPYWCDCRDEPGGSVVDPAAGLWFAPYGVGDVLTVCPCCDESAEGTCPKVTVRDIKPMRPQDATARCGWLGFFKHREFDAIYGEGAYAENALYWVVEVEHDAI